MSPLTEFNVELMKLCLPGFGEQTIKDLIHAHEVHDDLLETIRWMAQTIHQAYHQEHPGIFLECPKNTCDAARQAIQKERTQ